MVGQERRYHVELWPIGNQFDAGHRLRLHVLGVSGASQPTTPAVNTIRLGEGGSRLHFPILPGSGIGLDVAAHTPADGDAVVTGVSATGPASPTPVGPIRRSRSVWTIRQHVHPRGAPHPVALIAGASG